MWDLIVSVPDHCLSFYLEEIKFSKTVNVPITYHGRRCKITILDFGKQGPNSRNLVQLKR